MDRYARWLPDAFAMNQKATFLSFFFSLTAHLFFQAGKALDYLVQTLLSLHSDNKELIGLAFCLNYIIFKYKLQIYAVSSPKPLFFKDFGLLLKTIKARAYGIAVTRVHGMDESGVRLPVGPQ